MQGCVVMAAPPMARHAVMRHRAHADVPGEAVRRGARTRVRIARVLTLATTNRLSTRVFSTQVYLKTNLFVLR